MQITFRYDHLDQTPALEAHVIKKMMSIEHLVAGYPDARADVAFERTTGHHRSGDVFKVQIHLVIAGHTFDVDAQGDDVYAVVDEVRDTLHGTVQRFKEQDVAKRHAGA